MRGGGAGMGGDAEEEGEEDTYHMSGREQERQEAGAHQYRLPRPLHVCTKENISYLARHAPCTYVCIACMTHLMHGMTKYIVE